MPLSVNVSTGLVKGRFGSGVVAGSNGEELLIPARGRIDFEGMTPFTQFPTVDPPVTMLRPKATGILDSEGYLCTPDPADPSKPGERMLLMQMPNDPNSTVQGWTWKGTPRFVNADGTRLHNTMEPFTFDLPFSDVPFDLVNAVSVPESVGIGKEQAIILAASAQAAATSAAGSAEAAAADAKVARESVATAVEAASVAVSDAAAAKTTAETAAAEAERAVTDAGLAVSEASTAKTAAATAVTAAERAVSDSATAKTAATQAAADAEAVKAAGLANDAGVAGLLKTGTLSNAALSQSVSAATTQQVPPLVAKAIAADGTVAAAAGVAVEDALGQAGVVVGAVSTQPTPETQDYHGGFIGENGRPTDLVFDGDGRVLDSTIVEWGTRLAPVLGDQIKVKPTPKVEPRLGSNRNLWVRDGFGNARRQTSRADQFAAWGDSLTDGYPKPPFAVDRSDSWPGVLQKLLGKPVHNGGVEGQSADEIAVRAGALVPSFLPSGGKIPASGSVVITSPDQLTGWRTDRYFSDTGSLAGVPGWISRNSNAAFMFNRSTAGAEVSVATPQPWVSSGSKYSDATVILMLGRNDVGWESTGTQAIDRIVAANVAIIESLTPLHPRFLILGTINSTGEQANSAGWRTVTESNRILWEMYPESKLDIRSYIVKESIYDQGLTPTADDLTRMSSDAPPPQIMHDGVHFSVATANTIGSRIHKELKLKGWAA